MKMKDAHGVLGLEMFFVQLMKKYLCQLKKSFRSLS